MRGAIEMSREFPLGISLTVRAHALGILPIAADSVPYYIHFVHIMLASMTTHF